MKRKRLNKKNIKRIYNISTTALLPIDKLNKSLACVSMFMTECCWCSMTEFCWCSNINSPVFQLRAFWFCNHLPYACFFPVIDVILCGSALRKSCHSLLSLLLLNGYTSKGDNPIMKYLLAFLAHLSTKCSWWAIVISLCPSSVRCQLFALNNFSSKTAWRILK